VAGLGEVRQASLGYPVNKPSFVRELLVKHPQLSPVADGGELHTILQAKKKYTNKIKLITIA
jgi:hypothetical protein